MKGGLQPPKPPPPPWIRPWGCKLKTKKNKQNKGHSLPADNSCSSPIISPYYNCTYVAKVACYTASLNTVNALLEYPVPDSSIRVSQYFLANKCTCPIEVGGRGEWHPWTPSPPPIYVWVYTSAKSLAAV